MSTPADPYVMAWPPGSCPGLFPGSVIAIKATGRRPPPVSIVMYYGRISSAHDRYVIGCQLAPPRFARGVSEHVLDDVLAQRRLAGEVERILSVEAGRTKPRRRLLGGGDHAAQRDVTQRVRPDGMPYRLEHLLFVLDGVGDQL